MSVVEDPGKKVFLMGNEAIARGVIEAGVSVASSYPGTPASEIMGTLVENANHFGYYAEWAINEMVAFNVAAGAALVGKRGFCSLKNAGFNWIMDMLMTIVYGGVRGGLVVAVADDPNARTSSNEQDSRFGALWDEILCLEPSSQQEAKDMTKEAFDLSEALELPVVVRSVARISHSLGDVTLGDIRKDPKKPVFDKHWKLPFRFNVYGPPSTHSRHGWLHDKIPKVKEISNDSKYNSLKIVEGSEYAIITSGIASAYSLEALHWLNAENDVSLLKIGTVTPIPEKKVMELIKNVKKILVLEDGDPVIELQLRAFVQKYCEGIEIFGRMYERILPPYGELDPDMVVNAVANFIGKTVSQPSDERIKIKTEIESLVAPRSSSWCAGCPHMGTYFALRKALKKIGGKVPIVNGDIGCYEMAGYGVFAKIIDPSFSDESIRYSLDSPYELLDTLHVMGSGIGVSQGMSRAGYSDGKIVAIAGDSTFFHACIPSLINSVWNKTKLTFIIFDNGWTAMTGHQPDPGTGQVGMGEKTSVISIEDMCKACGVDFIKIGDPANPNELASIIEEAMQRDSTSVIISRRVCAQVLLRERRRKGETAVAYTIDLENCVGCETCVTLGCPAISYNKAERKAGISASLCQGCGICAEICPIKAIDKKGE